MKSIQPIFSRLCVELLEEEKSAGGIILQDNFDSKGWITAKIIGVGPYAGTHADHPDVRLQEFKIGMFVYVNRSHISPCRLNHKMVYLVDDKYVAGVFEQ